MVYQLDKDEIWFPDPHNGDEDGIFAVGGDLSEERLWLAYNNGIFPWYSFRAAEAEKLYDGDGIQWYCPMKRFVIFPNEIHISHSMRTLFNKDIYTVTINKDFDAVIDNCSSLRINEYYAWLGTDMVTAYKKLARRGCCISVEVWDEDQKLAGGLYGVLTQHVFCGESMFSLKPNTSKMALIYLSKVLEENDISLIDCQVETAHTKSMGGRYISYDEYMEYMKGEKK